MSEIDRAMLQSMAASFRGALEFSFNRHDMAKLMDRCATRTDLSQAAVAAALAAAKDALNKMPRREERLGGQRTQYIQLHEAVETIAALITDCDRDALAAHVAAEVAKARAEDAAVIAQAWTDGEPPKYMRDEWFIAETIHGDRCVLRALPKEYTYDYTTADHTYMVAKNIKRWMQFPDSGYKSFVPADYDAMRSNLDLPDDVLEFALKIGRAEWGQTDPKTAAEHAADMASTVEKTAAHFGQTEPQSLNGLYIEGTGIVICHTGVSPNSPEIARILTGLWNMIYDTAQIGAKP